jgi:hypothetical protein
MPSPTSGTGNEPRNGAIDTDTKYAESAMAPSRAAWPAGDEKERGATAAAARASPASNASNGDTATHMVKICSTFCNRIERVGSPPTSDGEDHRNQERQRFPPSRHTAKYSIR